MSLASDVVVDAFDASAWLLLASTPSAIADAAMSAAADIDEWTNTDNAERASFILAASVGVTADAKSGVYLHAQLLNFDDVPSGISTNDSSVVDGTNSEGIKIGVFTPWNANIATSTLQYLILPNAILPNIQTAQDYQFHVYNRTGQAIQDTWDLWIKTKGRILKA